MRRKVAASQSHSERRKIIRLPSTCSQLHQRGVGQHIIVDVFVASALRVVKLCLSATYPYPGRFVFSLRNDCVAPATRTLSRASYAMPSRNLASCFPRLVSSRVSRCPCSKLDGKYSASFSISHATRLPNVELYCITRSPDRDHRSPNMIDNILTHLRR
jgi:hypothetical protein